MVNDPIRADVVHPIQQPIKAIVVRWHDYQHDAEGVMWRVGDNGITRIEATMKNGEYAHIPYLRVWRGDVAVAEYCQHAVMEVLFDMAERSLDEPTRLAAARAEGVREGIEMAARWHDGEADRIRAESRMDSMKHIDAIGDHEAAAEAIRALALSPAPAEPEEPPCPVCGNEERGQGGYLSCACPAPAEPVQTDDGWVEWNGGECPMPEYASPEVRYRSGGTTQMQANRFRWRRTGAWDDIVAYRIVKPAEPGAPVALKARAGEAEARVTAWVERCFGAPAMALPERASRLMEEAIEMAQAAGVEREVAERSVAYIYGRPAGPPAQELGGVMLTAAACAAALATTMAAAFEAEMARVEAKSDDHFRARQAHKADMGMSARALVQGGAD